MLFTPSTQNSADSKGLPNYCFESIQACEHDIRRDLFKYIVLAGGSTMFKNMQERMRKEITALAPSSTVPGVHAPADRKHSQWLGGAILSTISKFNEMWITKKEYEQHGVSIVHKKCF
jgi:actin